MIKVDRLDNKELMWSEMAGVDPSDASRGQASVVGVVLIVGLTIMGVTGILVFGSSAISDAKTQSEIDAAEHAMTELDSQFSLVALGDSPHQSSSVMGLSGTSVWVDQDRGWMNVSVINRSTGEHEDTVFNSTMGAVMYENEGTTIAYQGGGVWKKAPTGGTIMVSPPEFHYRRTGGGDPTLTLPLVVVQGSGTVAERAIISRAGTLSKYPVEGNPDRTNPLKGGQINITVSSEYYQAWGTFFQERTGGTVSYNHDKERVNVDLVIPASAQSIGGGIVSGAAGSTLNFHNQAEADSYNSSAGDYASTSADNTGIVVAGSIELGNQGTIYGDLKTGGSVTLNNNAEVTGNVSYGGTLSNSGTIGGTTTNGGAVQIPNDVEWLIDDRRELISGSNNNGPEGNVDASNSLIGCNPECDLEGGNDYYLDEVNLDSGDTLRLDTSAGDISVVVDGDANLGDATITVDGDGTARFFVEGDMTLGEDGNVSVPNQRSTQMWFYMNPGASVEFGNGARLVGVVYGPGNGAQNGVDMNFNNHFTLYGALVGDVLYVNNHMNIHFDEALVGEDPMAGFGSGEPTVTYMHISLNKVNVSSK